MDATPELASVTGNEAKPPPSSLSGRGTRILMALGLIAALGVALWYYVASGKAESTDDAYVMAARVPISANVSGQVVEVLVRDNQMVHRGDVLFRLDEAPLRIAVEEAEAQLASAELQLRTLRANYLKREAEVTSAVQTRTFRQSELERLRRLHEAGVASQAQVDRAGNGAEEAEGDVASKQHEFAAVRAQLDGDGQASQARHPLILSAHAALDRARLNLSYALVRAPADGVATRVEQLQPGSFVTAGASTFMLVSTQDVWIEANFKESQLASMHPGQSATVRIDSYPGQALRGRVASVSPGTGSQFSLLPADNASGNWVKVVQRLPVRIELVDVSRPQLAAGLSATVEVDVRGAAGSHAVSTAQAEADPIRKQ